MDLLFIFGCKISIFPDSSEFFFYEKLELDWFSSSDC
jgi:hypothetical protein